MSDNFDHLFRPSGTTAMAGTQVLGRQAQGQAQPPAREGGQGAWASSSAEATTKLPAGGTRMMEPDWSGIPPTTVGLAFDSVSAGPKRPGSRGRGLVIGMALAVMVCIGAFAAFILGADSPSPKAAPLTTPSPMIASGAPAVAPPTTPPAVAPDTSQPDASSSPPSPSSAVTAVPAGDLTLGSSGAKVRALQTRLKQLGLYNGPIDGQYNQATAQAVIEFQASAGVLGDPAGVTGTSTEAALATSVRHRHH